jgi:hypothetical protein
VEQDMTQALRGDMGERMKRAGAQVGALTCSLKWDNQNDLDLHCLSPSGSHIFYAARTGSCTGVLDVDMNARARDAGAQPIENILWCAPASQPASLMPTHRPTSTATTHNRAYILYDVLLAFLSICWLVVRCRCTYDVRHEPPKGHYKFWVEAVDMDRAAAPTPFVVRLTKEGTSQDKTFPDLEEDDEQIVFEFDL